MPGGYRLFAVRLYRQRFLTFDSHHCAAGIYLRSSFHEFEDQYGKLDRPDNLLYLWRTKTKRIELSTDASELARRLRDEICLHLSFACPCVELRFRFVPKATLGCEPDSKRFEFFAFLPTTNPDGGQYEEDNLSYQ